MDEGSRAKRAKALEEKKRRLEELKNRRAANAQSSSSVGVGTNTSASTLSTTSMSTSTSTSTNRNLDSYIDGLLNSPAPKAVPELATPPVTPQGKLSAATPAAMEAASIAAIDTPHHEVPKTPVTVAPPTPAPAPVRTVETFTAGTQTEEEDFPPPLVSSDDDDDDDDDDKLPGESHKEADDASPAVPPTSTGSTHELLPAVTPKKLNEEERTATIASDPFGSFVVDASKRVERLLGASTMADLLWELHDDEPSIEGTGTNSNNNKTSNNSKKNSSLVLGRATFECGRWTAGRPVTSIDWSTAHKELLVCSYHRTTTTTATATATTTTDGWGLQLPHMNMNNQSNKSSALTPLPGEAQSDGLAAVWNLAMPGRPEHILTSSSPLLTVKFHPLERQLVVGGSHDGRLLLWDLRQGRLPVQRSTLSTVANKGKGHQHPLICLDVYGGSGLVSASTDGRINVWSLSQLRDPAESFMVPGHVSSLAVAPETLSLVVGDETGKLHTVPKSSPGGAHKPRTLSSSHFGMVTALSTHRLGTTNTVNSNKKGFLEGASGLVLSCGVDWSTQLWAPALSDQSLLQFHHHTQNGGANTTSGSSGSGSGSSGHRGGGYDYMADVQWSPIASSVFCTGSSSGVVGVWDLSQDLEEAVGDFTVGSSSSSSSSSSSYLNSLRWSHDGRRLAVATGDQLEVLHLPELLGQGAGGGGDTMMTQLAHRGYLPNTNHHNTNT